MELPNEYTANYMRGLATHPEKLANMTDEELRQLWHAAERAEKAASAILRLRKS